MNRAIGYARLSQEGKSIPEQIEEIEEYCENRSLDLLDIYNDGEQSSGYTDEREEYQRLLEHLRDDDRDVDHVVVRGLSRLSRDRLHRMQLLIELHREDVDVHAVDRGSRNPVDLSEPWALTREAGQADADDVEKRKEAERGRQEAERRAELGLPNGQPPIGLAYGPDSERWVPGDQFDVALRVLELRDAGYSYREIATRVDVVSKDQVGTILDRRGEYEALVTSKPSSES
ncbi:recombinase family protein [Halobellus ruber]|uniref:Recombinase family protein n=1 Tax=Halobellus ruber TaxID=2761102 RepID=A0A7J9SDU6_9EURY|nr:recombinase family protein [Halobellus ruber]MBB6645080.1 recombinase family protein [Halobellus ruber]